MNNWLTNELRTTGMAILSALLLTASFPKIDLHGLAWVALVPLLWALKDVNPGAFAEDAVPG
jgi:apolipoprotein N-acyltransferase